MVSWLHLRTCPISSRQWPMQDELQWLNLYKSRRYIWCLDSHSSKKSNNHVSCNKLSEGSPGHLAGVMGDTNSIGQVPWTKSWQSAFQAFGGPCRKRPRQQFSCIWHETSTIIHPEHYIIRRLTTFRKVNIEEMPLLYSENFDFFDRVFFKHSSDPEIVLEYHISKMTEIGLTICLTVPYMQI